MTGGTYKLRIADFKKMVKLIIAFVLINLLGFGVLIGLIGSGKLDPDTFPLEVVLIGFFVVVAGAFFVLQKKNMADEDVMLDKRSIHTSRFGIVYMNEVKGYKVSRKKKREDLVLELNDGRKISFGPLVGRRSDNKKVYADFKEAVIDLIQKSQNPQ